MTIFRNTFKLIIFFKLVLIFGFNTTIAQIMPSNNFKFKPEIFDSLQLRGNKLVENVYGFGVNSYFNSEFQVTSNSYKNEKDRIFRLNGVIEIFKSKRDIILLSLNNELNANSLNDISFNPRQAIWEENLVYLHNLGKFNNKHFIYNINLFHRCKHDIDNLDPANSDVPDLTANLSKRVVILTGLTSGLTISNSPYYYTSNIRNNKDYTKEEEVLDIEDTNQINKDNITIDNVLFSQSKFRYYSKVEFEYYLNKSDSRFPYTEIQYDWAKLVLGNRFNFRLDYEIQNNYNIFTKTDFTLLFFEKSQTRSNYNIEFGANFTGQNMTFELYFTKQFLFDELVFVDQNNTQFYGIGLRLLNLNFY